MDIETISPHPLLSKYIDFYYFIKSDSSAFKSTHYSFPHTINVISIYENATINGGHSLPYNMPDSLNFLYDQLSRQIRNPFPKKVEWETDDVRNGRNAWIEITALDTLAQKADWHSVLNPTITKDGKEVKLQYNKNKAGAVIATAVGNKINIQTSCIKKVSLYISADMFDLTKQLQITINNKKFINLKLELDKKDLIHEFMKTRDRAFLVSKKIELTIE